LEQWSVAGILVVIIGLAAGSSEDPSGATNPLGFDPGSEA